MYVFSEDFFITLSNTAIEYLTILIIFFYYKKYMQIYRAKLRRIFMRRIYLFFINVLVAMLLVLLPSCTKPMHPQNSAEAQMMEGSGHGTAHGQDKKSAMTEDKTHSGHGDSKTDHDHQATSMSKKMPKHLDVALAKYSEDAKFYVGITSKLKPVAINKIHSWVLQIRKPDGERVSNAKIHVSGGMPMHGHGLPTSPRVTKYLNDGKYLIEGVRFNMTGWWELKFMIKSGHHKENITFNIILK